jgi:hypothetical protein
MRLVQAVMMTQVVTVGPATPFKEIVGRLAEHRLSAVPVVDDDGCVLGVVSAAGFLLKEEFLGILTRAPVSWGPGGFMRRLGLGQHARAGQGRDLQADRCGHLDGFGPGRQDCGPRPQRLRPVAAGRAGGCGP